MTRANEVVAGLIEEYGDLLSITGGEAFKVRVYEKAARAIAGHHADVSDLKGRMIDGPHDIPATDATNHRHGIAAVSTF